MTTRKWKTSTIISKSYDEEVDKNYAIKRRACQKKIRYETKVQDLDGGILNMAQARRYCGVSDSTLMRLINTKILVAEQVAPFAPYEIKQAELKQRTGIDKTKGT